MADALAAADSATRSAVVEQLQRECGNAYVQRLAAGRTLQRQPTTSSAPAAGRKALERAPQEPAAAAAEAPTTYNLKIGRTELKNLSRERAVKALWGHHGLILGWIGAGERAHQRMKEIRESQWIVGSISDFLARPGDTLRGKRLKLPDPSIWQRPKGLLGDARGKLHAKEVLASVAALGSAEDAFISGDKQVNDYRKGTITGAERAKTTLEVTAVAGAVAATVVTGGVAAKAGIGLLGVAGATGGGAGVYGMAQEGATQIGESGAGMRQKFDLLAIVRRGATDFATGFAAALAGGALSKLFARALGPYLSNIGDDVLAQLGKQVGLNGPLPRDFLLTRGQRFLADLLGGVGSTPVATAVSTVVNRALGGQGPRSMREFIGIVARDAWRGGLMQLFLGGIAHARGRIAPASPAAAVEGAAAPVPATGTVPTARPLTPIEAAPTLPGVRPLTPVEAAPTLPGSRPLTPGEAAPTVKVRSGATLPGLGPAEASLPAGPGLSQTLPPLSTTQPPLPVGPGASRTLPPLPATEVPADASGSATRPALPGAATVAATGRFPAFRRIEDVALAQRLRDEWMRAGREVHQRGSSRMLAEEWRLHGQAGDPPPAFVDAWGALHVDTSRCGWASPDVLLGSRQAGRLAGGAAQPAVGGRPARRGSTLPPPSAAGQKMQVARRITSEAEAIALRDQHAREGKAYIERQKPEYYAEDYRLGGGTGQPPPAYLTQNGTLVFDARRIGSVPEALLGSYK